VRAIRNVRIKFMDREVECLALFDSGSGVTVARRDFFENSFGTSWQRLSKPLKLYWINGMYMEVDKYAQITIVIDGFELPETVFIVDSFVKEIEVGGRRISLPELIIGSGTMDKYGIVLDPREGVKVVGASLLL